jgi:hypothetical protein
MDPVQAAQSNNQQSSHRGLLPILRNKWFLILAGVAILIGGISLLLISGNAGRKSTPNATAPTVVPVTIFAQPTVAPEKQAEMNAAIQEAKQSAQEYDNAQRETLTSYPWLKKLPLAKEKYYVYFDISKKAFVGRLYPTAGDNVEQLKTLAIQELRLKQIPTDNFPFEWFTFPR